MKAERQQPRLKSDSLSVDVDDTIVRRPRKKATTDSTLFRNVFIGLVIVAGCLYALSQRYDLAKLLVIDLNNPSASLAQARTDKPADTATPAAEQPAGQAAPARGAPHVGQATHAQPVAPSTSVALPANVNVAPVYLGKEKERK
jgi:hypothetical protein